MKKRAIMVVLVTLVLVVSMMLSACGASDTEVSPGKQTASAIMEEGGVPVEATVDVSKGYSIAFYPDGFNVFAGENTDDAYPLATATILTKEVYDKYVADNKDSDSFREEDGVIRFVSESGEQSRLFMIEDKVPFMVTFEKSADEEKADELMEGIDLSLRQ